MEINTLTTALAAVAMSAASLGATRAGQSGGTAKKETVKTVTVLRDEDCGSPAIARIQQLAAKLGLEIQVAEVIVTTQEQADKQRYLGSPTVQIAGLDIDPKARARTSYALG